MVSQNQSVLHDKGTNRLLADIAATPQERMMAELVERTKNRVGDDCDVSLDFVVRWTGTFKRFAETLYTCRIIGNGTQLLCGKPSVDPVEACRSAVQAWSEDRIKAQRESQVAAENRAAAAIETSDFLTGCIFDESGGCVADTDEPLVKLGQGDYTREVRP